MCYSLTKWYGICKLGASVSMSVCSPCLEQGVCVCEFDKPAHHVVQGVVSANTVRL